MSKSKRMRSQLAKRQVFSVVRTLIKIKHKDLGHVVIFLSTQCWRKISHVIPHRLRFHLDMNKWLSERTAWGWFSEVEKTWVKRCERYEICKYGQNLPGSFNADYPSVWQEIKAVAVRPAAGKRLVEEEIIISASKSPHLYGTFHWRCQVQRKLLQTPVNHWRKRWPDCLHNAC